MMKWLQNHEKEEASLLQLIHSIPNFILLITHCVSKQSSDDFPSNYFCRKQNELAYEKIFRMSDYVGVCNIFIP